MILPKYLPLRHHLTLRCRILLAIVFVMLLGKLNKPLVYFAIVTWGHTVSVWNLQILATRRQSFSDKFQVLFCVLGCLQAHEHVIADAPFESFQTRLAWVESHVVLVGLLGG